MGFFFKPYAIPRDYCIYVPKSGTKSMEMLLTKNQSVIFVENSSIFMLPLIYLITWNMQIWHKIYILRYLSCKLMKVVKIA